MALNKNLEHVRDTATARWRRRPSWAGPASLLLVGGVVLWCCVFGVLVYLRQDRFHSADFDLGIYDQAIWLLARGEKFMTVRGLNVFGQHGSVAFYLLAPFSWMGAGPHFLNILQVASLGLAAVAVFFIARFHLQNDWIAAALAIAFLLHPSVQWFAQELFHPEVMAIPPLLFAYLAALHRRWYLFFGLCLLAVAWKEDIALAVAVLGVILILRKERRVGLVTLFGAILWFLLITQVLVAREGGGVFYARQFYGDFGSTSTEVGRTILTRPDRVVDRLRDADAPGYVRNLTEPYAFVSLLSPLTLLIGFPQALFNLISVQNFTWRTDLHYAAMPVTAATIAMVEAVARANRPGLRRFVVGLVVMAAWGTTVASGAAPVSREFRAGMWPLQENAKQSVLEAAVRTPPSHAVVSASYGLVPHLTHRRGIFSFPNPWILTNFGQSNESGPNPSVVQWLVIDRATVGAEGLQLLDRLLGSGEFQVVAAGEDVVVAARQSYCRRHPPRCTRRPLS